uniref:Uncharacterized protein n=1 Tax=Physcomitrium patens TaxID=3218 RepID=A0A7I4F3J0_PHYPA
MLVLNLPSGLVIRNCDHHRIRGNTILMQVLKWPIHEFLAWPCWNDHSSTCMLAKFCRALLLLLDYTHLISSKGLPRKCHSIEEKEWEYCFGSIPSQ